MARKKSNGLLYIRRSSGKQEISLPSQVEWGISAAAEHNVVLDVSIADLEYMQANHLSSYKSLRMDDGITGFDMTRPGFLALNSDAIADKKTSHVFIYKRDRFARPADAMQAAQFEKSLLLKGITIVLSDGTSNPIHPGEACVMRDVELIIFYSQNGEEIRKLSERVLGFQRTLAEKGFRTGGSAPYGFVRVLVDANGKILEELPPKKHVRMQGCHVRVVPKDPVKIAVWLQILAWRQKRWGYKRIARELNNQGIPSPDSGRTRTDHGVKHFVSGKWNPNTIAELCQNPIILGEQQYGKRSEGKIRRLGAQGPRMLDEESDLAADGKPRVIINDPSLRITRKIGVQEFEKEQWEAIQQMGAVRGKNQRGIPRTKDPARYPLSCRLVDLTDGCGSILYCRTNQGRAVYTCGRYMKTAGAECNSNQVDAEAMLRFVVMTLQQVVGLAGNRAKLREKLRARAEQARKQPNNGSKADELALLQCRLNRLKNDHDQIERRMSVEADNVAYAGLKRQHAAVTEELNGLQKEIEKNEALRIRTASTPVQTETDAALAVLDDVDRIVGSQIIRSEVNVLMQNLGIRIGLTFGSAIKGKKRVVRQLLSGRMVFGNLPLPVPLFGKENAENRLPHQCGQSSLVDGDNSLNGGLEKQNAGTGAYPVPASASGGQTPGRPIQSQPESISITKDNRAERI